MDARNRLQLSHSDSDSDEKPYDVTSNISSTSYLHFFFSAYGGQSTSSNPTPQLLVNANQKEPDSPSLTEISTEEIASALKAARESTPSVIKVLNHPSKMNICILGCQGNKQTDLPMQVAKLMNEKKDFKPDLIIILGDNYYPDGVSSPADTRIQTHFHDVYGNPDFSNICGVPCIKILGNHDGGRDTETYVKSWVPGDPLTNPVKLNEAELQQIAHSMMQHPSDPTQLNKPLFFKQETVNYKDLPKDLIPHFFHSWIFDKLQIFALNSNTYVKDFINHLEKFAEDKESNHYLDYMKKLVLDKANNPILNQAAWLEVEYAFAMEAKRSPLFALHHPVISMGKREYRNGWDAHHYLSTAEITLINAILKLSPDQTDFKDKLNAIFKVKDNTYYCTESNANYNEMLRNIFYIFQKMNPNLVCAAHDHSNYYFNNTNDHTNKKPNDKKFQELLVYVAEQAVIRQLVAGGGGSKDLQHRGFYGQHENMGAFARKHGYSAITCDTANPAILDIHMFTTDGIHLHFNNLDSKPLRNPEIDDNVKTIREIVLSECGKYQEHIDKLQNACKGNLFKKVPAMYVNMYSPKGMVDSITNHHYLKIHTHQDMDIIHDIMNYLNQKNPSSYADTVTFLHECMNKLYNKEWDHSLYMAINQQLQIKFKDNSIDQLYNEIKSSNLTLNTAL